MRSAFAPVFCGAQISQAYNLGGGEGTGTVILYNGRISFLKACVALVDQNLRHDFSI